MLALTLTSLATIYQQAALPYVTSQVPLLPTAPMTKMIEAVHEFFIISVGNEAIRDLSVLRNSQLVDVNC